jgi:DNA polymerase III alpha subunit (gram-positive type)
MKLDPKETYISIDVETDGSCPGFNSMLSLGAIAFDHEGLVFSDFSANLEPLEGATPNLDTMKWWEGYPEEYELATYNPLPAYRAMQDFHAWVKALPGRPVFVAYPLGFDFTFVYWYLCKFVGQSPFAFSGIDIKTLAWTLCGGEFRGIRKGRFPESFFPENAGHAHIALDDAREQAEIFLRIVAQIPEPPERAVELRDGPKPVGG